MPLVHVEHEISELKPNKELIVFNINVPLLLPTYLPKVLGLAKSGPEIFLFILIVFAFIFSIVSSFPCSSSLPQLSSLLSCLLLCIITCSPRCRWFQYCFCHASFSFTYSHYKGTIFVIGIKSCGYTQQISH
mmetsp:Transcript_19564/g.28653  ORF Transcript_19564/g.28653 Transcript_19564/m.28653 type:complete len:132 (+) Transcript_19564:1958-2353(+)